MKTTRQTSLFGASDLPLFSLCPVTVFDPAFKPAQVNRQHSLFSAASQPPCPVCYGTGQVVTRKGKPARRCICVAGTR